MDQINIQIVPIEDSVDEIIGLMRSEFSMGEDEMLIEIESKLESLFDQMIDTAYVVIDSPYVDKFYRDSFYTYFASKHRHYHRDCIRISFFQDEITSAHFRDKDLFEDLNKKFLGYLILRPTFPRVVGRSMISTKAFIDSNFVICTHQANISLNGIKLTTTSFPHSSQDGESISCAETTIWALMEYFGNRYPDYRPVGISSIIETLSKYSKKRMLPSAGLTVDQISYVIKEFGFGTFIYSRETAYDDEIEKIISVYIESGIPILAAIENDQIGHAILVIGYEKEDSIDFDNQIKSKINFEGEEIDFVDYADVKRYYIVQDDNLDPFRKIHLDKPTEHYSAAGYGSEWDDAEIDSIIVPLYRKIYLEAETAKQLALKVLQDEDLGYNFDKDFVFRFYLTSSRSFKYHIATLTALDPIIADNIIITRMPKFIWVAEIYTKEQYTENTASGIIILDATEASENKKDALLFVGYPDRCTFKNGNEFVTLSQVLRYYIRFKNNLN